MATPRPPESLIADAHAVWVSPRVAAVLLGPAGVGRWLREHAGEDQEVDMVGLALTLAVRSASSCGHVPPVTDPLDHDRLVSASQAAASVGVTRRTINRWIAEGQLPAVLVGRGWAVHFTDLAELVERRAA